MAPARALPCSLLWLIGVAVASQLTKEQMDAIVDLHNMYRASVKPQAADMTRMTWSEDSRLVAEGYVSQCIWDHNPDVEDKFGENLFITTGSLNISKVMLDWFKEHEHYDYDNNQCPHNEMCGHYTQMVWAESTGVGCATHVCDTVQGLPFLNSTLVVCNYLPPGNVMGHRPYQAGEPCSKCPQDRTVCVEMVCDQAAVPSVEPSAGTDYTDITPSTKRTAMNGTHRERELIGSSAVTGTLFARPSAVKLMLAGLLAILVF